MKTTPQPPHPTVEVAPQFTHRFTYRGRPYQLYKRQLSRDGSFYVCVQKQRKRVRQSLETNDRATAVDRAKQLIDAVLAEKWTVAARLKARGPDVVTLATVFELYDRLTTISELSRRNNKGSLVQVIRHATGHDITLDKWDISGIDDLLVTKFQTATVRRYLDSSPKDDQAQREARERALRSSRSVVFQARSLFCKRLPDLYRENGVILPDGSLSVGLCADHNCERRAHEQKQNGSGKVGKDGTLIF